MSVSPRPPSSAPDGDSLSPAALLEIEVANARVRELRGVLRIAMFNGVTIGFFAGLSLLIAVANILLGSPGPTSWAMGLAMSVLAWNEFRGRSRVRLLDASGPKLLGWNQVAFASLLVVYCLWSIHVVRTQPIEGIERVEEVFGPIEEQARAIAVMAYGVIAVLAAGFQGLNAWYYFRRGRVIAEHVAATPEWVLKLQRENPPI